MLEKSGKDKGKWTYCKQDRYTLSDVGLHQVQEKKQKNLFEKTNYFEETCYPKTSFNRFLKQWSV